MVELARADTHHPQYVHAVCPPSRPFNNAGSPLPRPIVTKYPTFRSGCQHLLATVRPTTSSPLIASRQGVSICAMARHFGCVCVATRYIHEARTWSQLCKHSTTPPRNPGLRIRRRPLATYSIPSRGLSFAASLAHRRSAANPMIHMQCSAAFIPWCSGPLLPSRACPAPCL